MKRWRLHYEQHFLTYELAAALIFGSGLIAFVELGWGREQLVGTLEGARQGMYAAVASIAGSLFGFIVTTVSIIMGFVRLPRLRLVRESAHYPTLYTIFFSTIRYLAVVTAWALIALTVDRDSEPRVWATYLLFLVALVAAVRLYRCVWVMEKVIRVGIQRESGGNNQTFGDGHD